MTFNVGFSALRFGSNLLHAMQRGFVSAAAPSKLLLALTLLSAAGSLSAQPLLWVSGPAIPQNATFGGHENGAPLYVCRGWYNGGVHPGKVIAGRCNIGYAWKEIALSDFQVLTGPGTWAGSQSGYSSSFRAGHERGGPLYLCRASYNNGIHPGKVLEGRCHITWGGNEVARPDFEVFYADSRPRWRRSGNSRF